MTGLRLPSVLLAVALVACAGSGNGTQPPAPSGEAGSELALQQGRAAWGQAIAVRVRAAWVMPEGAPENFRCILRIELGDEGRVTNAALAEPCGSEELDRSVISAAWRASPLPLPEYAPAFDAVLKIRLCRKPGPPC